MRHASTALALLALIPTLGSAQTHFRTFLGNPSPVNHVRSFAAAGDVDGDGFQDAMFQRFSPSGSDVEVVSVIDGRTLFVFDGGPSEFSYGTEVVGVGDVNADGHDDLALGVVNGFGAASNSGRVEVRSGADGSLLYELQGLATGDRFGASLAAVDDVDGDGAGEIAVGAWGAAATATSGGAVSLYSGASGSLLWTAKAPPSARLFGLSIAGLGDTNGDGAGDLAVGAPGTAAFGTGRVIILSTTDGSQLLEIPAAPGDPRFGRSVAGVGDTTGDGFGDLVVGAPDEITAPPAGPGAAYLLSGRDGSVVFRVPGIQVGARVENAGDFDGDGRADFLVDIPISSNITPASVRVYSSQLGNEIVRVESQLGSFANVRACSLGDLDGDNTPELLVHNLALGTYGAWLGRNAFQVPGCLPPVANSAGLRSTIQYSGSASIEFGFAQLVTSGLPADSLALSIASRTVDFVPGAGGGQGTLCLGGSIGRFLGPGQVTTANASGSSAIDIDLTALPQPSGAVAAMAGEAWHFQTWYRDQVSGNATSNFSSRISLTLR